MWHAWDAVSNEDKGQEEPDHYHEKYDLIWTPDILDFKQHNLQWC